MVWDSLLDPALLAPPACRRAGTALILTYSVRTQTRTALAKIGYGALTHHHLQRNCPWLSPAVISAALGGLMQLSREPVLAAPGPLTVPSSNGGGLVCTNGMVVSVHYRGVHEIQYAKIASSISMRPQIPQH